MAQPYNTAEIHNYAMNANRIAGSKKLLLPRNTVKVCKSNVDIALESWTDKKYIRQGLNCRLYVTVTATAKWIRSCS